MWPAEVWCVRCVPEWPRRLTVNNTPPCHPFLSLSPVRGMARLSLSIGFRWIPANTVGFGVAGRVWM